MNKHTGWLLLLPAAALCVGIVCLAEPEIIKRTPAVFTPVMEQVQMKQVRSTSNVPGAKSYHVAVFVGYHGMKPGWWGQKEGTLFNKTITNISGKNGPQLLNPCFVSRTGRKYNWNPVGQLPSLYDPVRQQYYVDLETEVSADFPVQNCTITGTIKMGDGSTVKVSALVSQALQHPPAPSVQCP